MYISVANVGPEADPPDRMDVEEPAVAESTSVLTVDEIPVVETKPVPITRKGGRPPQKRRLGRNQYTKDAPMPATNGVSFAAEDISNSPQINPANGNGHDSSDGVTSGRTGKPKNWLQKLSWHDIRRPAGAMQSYISQRQVEMAGEKPAIPVRASAVTINGSRDRESNADEEDLARFKKLNTLQMMDHLSRDLTHWQQLVSESNEK